MHLVFEITESVLLEDDPRVSASLRAFRDLGIGIVVDDFGTGYSALSYLRRLPVTALKIDGSFVRDIEADEDDANLVESIVAMTRALRIGSVAECVETQRQAQVLRAMGCRHAQGYLYGRPLPAAQFAQRWIEGDNSHRPPAEDAPGGARDQPAGVRESDLPGRPIRPGVRRIVEAATRQAAGAGRTHALADVE